MKQWDINQARLTYNITHWGNDYFDINALGHVTVRRRSADQQEGVDLYRLAHEIRSAGLSWPVLVRITDILEDRVQSLAGAFRKAMQEDGYLGRFTAVFPIKVNQQRTVVEHILANHAGNVGLEAGSKPELMVVLAYAPANAVIVCNGYKDREYIRLALIGQMLGHRVHIVVEKLSELDLIIEESKNLGVKPMLGVRVRLSSIGKGKWQNTGGEKSKFGLSGSQVLAMVNRLKSIEALDWLVLTHCHIGSQLANIRDIQKALKEVARYYAELRNLGVNIQTVDVGGGLGIDYEGTRSRSECSMNYSMQEYANDVVHALWEVCVEENLPHPNIVTESGRAMTAHHAVLISNVIDIERAPGLGDITQPSESDDIILSNLWHTLQNVTSRSAIEAYHDAAYWLGEAQTMFMHGILNLEHRAAAEELYYAICRRVQPLLQTSARAHREVLDELSEKLADKYFCNLSIFQSMPDIWAIDQIFPIMPLHRLDEEPVRRAILQDLTCDSDGAINAYVDTESVESTLPIHHLNPNEPYLIGVFLVGAYQEILGDMHNLFGDTHSINLEFTPDGNYNLVEPELGDSVDDVLSYVHYSAEKLVACYREKIAASSMSHAAKEQCLQELEDGMTGYTYLED